jgi:hypothetical protein
MTTNNTSTNESLKKWDNLPTKEFKSLLLGNGFSINIWEKFNYDSLLELAKRESCDRKLPDEVVNLFTDLGSSNFEDVLRILYHAMLVDSQLGNPQKKSIDSLYRSTKEALASAVKFAHIPYSEGANFREINKAFAGYQNVFTTNYDLIPYWSLMADPSKFYDYFWGDDSSFDIEDSEPWDEKKTRLYHLHGAIHLVEKADGITKKLTVDKGKPLSALFDLGHPEQTPLFISESNYKEKLLRIRRNDYLRFCYEKLESVNDGLVVLGHSLNENYDQHIIKAINSQPCGKVAIGVWSGLSDKAIALFIKRIEQALPSIKLFFFDSKTHPLGGSALNTKDK